MIPLFANIFSIYAMSNLHDISWGNRPATTNGGTEAFTSNAAEQQQTKIKYMAYRANFLFFWLVLNGCYFVFVLVLGEVGNTYIVNDGSIDVLTGFALYLSGIVVFRIFFAILYLCKWQWRYNFNPKYKIKEVNLEAIFKKFKKNATTGDESSDD